MKKNIFIIFLAIICCFSLTSCADVLGSAEYTLIEDGTAYEVSYNGIIVGNIEVPAEYEGLPVKGIVSGSSLFSLFNNKVTIAEGVVYMDYEALAYGDFSSIHIPASMTFIDSSALCGNDSLKSITVAEDNPVYHSQGNCIIETETKTLIAGCKKSEIPSDGSVTSIAAESFSSIYGFRTIKIPSTITEIGDMAFFDCKDLKSIEFDGTMEQWYNIAKGNYWNSTASLDENSFLGGSIITLDITVHCIDGDTEA